MSARSGGRDVRSVTVGEQLPPLELPLSPTFVITTALASRDFEEVHHDVDVARARGLDHIFLNILTTNGLVQRLVTDWAGPETWIARSSIRLGVPATAGDTLRLTGEVARVEVHGDLGEVEVRVRGVVASGDHVTGTVVATLPVGDPS